MFGSFESVNKSVFPKAKVSKVETQWVDSEKFTWVAGRRSRVTKLWTFVATCLID